MQRNTHSPRSAAFKLVALTTFGLTAAPATHAQSIINGGFNSDASGWTATNVDGSGGYFASGGDPGGYFELNSNGGATDPTLSQTITGLVIGNVYTITGEFRPKYINGGASNGFGAAINGSTFYEGVNPSFTTWKPFQFNFQATGTTAVLSLSAERNGSDDDYGIDNIAISPAPEPSACAGLALGALALGGLALWARRRTTA